MLCNYLQNVAAITYIFVLQLSTFLFYNKHICGSTARVKTIRIPRLSCTNINEQEKRIIPKNSKALLSVTVTLRIGNWIVRIRISRFPDAGPTQAEGSLMD